MANKKNYQIFLFVMACILLNYGGKAFAAYYQLPVWMDSMGTVLTAYTMGPVCGAIVGLTTNIIYSFHDPISLLYGLANVAVGVVTGIYAKRRFFDSIFGTISVSVIVTLISVVVSTPLNFLLYGGSTGNLWGDGVIGFLTEMNVDPLLCSIVGEFYVDFVDKCLMLLVLYLLIQTFGHPEKHRGEAEQHGRHTAAMLAVCCLLGTAAAASTDAAAASVGNTYASSSYVQTVYSSSNGLPCGEANDIAQTNDGTLWIGTYAGLYRYNGSEFRWMSEYESVKNVNCLYVDEEGRLWIGTNDNGLTIIINEALANVVDEDDGMPSGSVRNIVQCADGNYYIGTSGSLQIIALNGGLKVLDEIPEVNYAASIAADESGYVAAVTAAGDLCLLRDRKLVYSERLERSKGQYTCCAFDENGILYVGTSEERILTFHVKEDALRQKGVIMCYELRNMNSLDFSENGELFICADNGAGYLDVYDRFHWISTGSFNNSIDNMTVDYQGNLWFTSSRMGVLRLCESDFTNYYGLANMENQVVNTMTIWQKKMYVGTDSGLNILDLDRKIGVENALTEALRGIRIRCICVDSQGHMWICTYGKGLWEINGGEITVYNAENGTFGDRARVVLEMSDGTIVAAGDSGITAIADGEIRWTLGYGAGLSNAMILSLMEMGDGSLLAGTDGDGMVVIRNGKVVRKIVRADGLSSGVILRTVADRDCGTFVVTSNSLCYMDGDYQISALNNFPYFNNYDIWESDEGRLFVLGSAGIYVVDRETLLSGGTVDYELLDAKSGLTGALTANAWNYCSEADHLYLSCDSGVFGLDLQSYGRKSHSYRMLVSKIKLDEAAHNVERGEVIRIDRDVNKIEIFPEVINYSIEDPYVSYYMEGFDAQPTIMLQSDLAPIVYTNLPSGSYTFHLCVLESEQGGILEESTYTIEKEMEIYDHSWFLVYLMVVLLLAVAWFTWFIGRTQVQRTLNLQKRELEIAKRQIEMGNQTILAIARTVDAKDENTSLHSQRVSDYSVLIAKELGMNEEECENLRKMALLHDIGKIGIADKVLNKTDRLTDEEYEIMKSHVTRGAEILKDFTLVDHVSDGVLYHHERYDGKGYVHGLKGEEIPLNARIIGIADAFDAMTANRVYRKKLSFDIVLEEIRKGRGTQFDPEVTDIMLKLIEDGKIDAASLYGEKKEA